MNLLRRLVNHLGKPSTPPPPVVSPSLAPMDSGAMQQYRKMRDEDELQEADKEIYRLTNTLRGIQGRAGKANNEQA